MRLSEICQGVITLDESMDLEVNGIQSDSREISHGDVFCACVGQIMDGRRFIAKAIEKGAVCVLAEAESEQELQAFLPEPCAVPVIPVANLSTQLGCLADNFFQHPSAQMTVMGVTGTNGKTSVAHFFAKALTVLGVKAGIMGTNGCGFPDALEKSRFTTPMPVEFHRQLHDLHQRGAEAVGMEVSSHGLDQHRVQGCHFSMAVFTNLTRDHLDYHGDMQHYANAKRQLFDFPDLQCAILNGDDPYGTTWSKELAERLPVYVYSTRAHCPLPKNATLIQARDVQLDHAGISARICTPWGEGDFTSPLFGRFNLQNLLAVLTCLCVMGYEFNNVLDCLSHINGIDGRMQVFGGGDHPTVIVDYAHTPDALEKALMAIKEHCHGHITCVFGCGGERDQGKRPLMAAMAEQFSDQIIVTNDNPRHEDPQQICRDIIAGIRGHGKTIIELDRQQAIFAAIKNASAKDVILIAGKGHEDYQILGDERVHFSDQQQVLAALAECWPADERKD